MDSSETSLAGGASPASRPGRPNAQLSRPLRSVDPEEMGGSVSTLSASAAPAHHSRTPSVRRRAETQDSDKAGRSWAREVDDPWWPCILTLDGGGIRGFSSLIILQALMHEVWLWEQKLDKEEAMTGEEGGTVNVESPTRLREDHLDSSGGALEQASNSRNEAQTEHTERQYGVSPRHPTIAATESATTGTAVQRDGLTADVTAKKATSEEELLPCHYFDFMYGTSTGGLIATILGRLRMTVKEGLELYEKVGDDLFGKRRSRLPLRTKYYHRPLEKAVQDLVGARCHEHVDCNGKDDLHPWDIDSLDGPVPFDVGEPPTHDANISEAYLLRSYPHYYTEDAPNWITRYNEGADQLPIWAVTRATSAAPFFFNMIECEVDGVKKSFKDGGIRENNPSGAALSEFHALYEGRADRPALLLSVGTGRPDQSQDGFADAWTGPFGRLIAKFLEQRAVVQNLLIKYTDGEKQHHQMREHAHGEHTWYKRLNVSSGLEGFALDDWRKGEYRGRADFPGGASLSHMQDVTERYLERDFDPEVDSYAPPRIMLQQAAEKLVRQRRAREREGGPRWKTFVGQHLHSAPASKR
ncbi:hypothetical protein LTR53_012075 [Teratosphaeriaceae sp. CCFEE 6253]|nr:hypothetical protein LTR53_012075 [Teratosphaeriaceae sp. CCFEE 6253]